jgi:dephospho-CoA kinase
MPLLALTGGIASGKSTIARLLAQHGAVIVDADAIVRELQAPGLRCSTRSPPRSVRGDRR